MIYKNRERIWDDEIAKPDSCRTRDFSNANPMDPEKVLKNEENVNNFQDFFQNSLIFYLISWEKQNML